MFDSKIIVKIDELWYDLTEFAELHPGGKQVLKRAHKKDVSENFYKIHEHKHMQNAMKKFLITDEKIIEKYNKKK